MTAKHDPSPPNGRCKVLIVDDHPAFCLGLARTIETIPNLEVCGEAPNRHDALRLMAQTQPHLATVDINLIGSSGLDLIKDTRLQFPSVAVLVISAYPEHEYGIRCLRAGAHGYLTKGRDLAETRLAIQTVLAGELYASESLARTMARSILGRPRAAHSQTHHDLSDKEWDVFRLVGQGCSTKEIARRVGVEVTTIKTHRTRILLKLGLKNSHELLQRAIHWSRESGNGAQPGA